MINRFDVLTHAYSRNGKWEISKNTAQTIDSRRSPSFLASFNILKFTIHDAVPFHELFAINH